MKSAIKTVGILTVVCIAVLWCATGCATKGGWPCFAWDRNTDQKNERAGEYYLKQQQYEEVIRQYWAETNLVKKAELNAKAQKLHDELSAP